MFSHIQTSLKMILVFQETQLQDSYNLTTFSRPNRNAYKNIAVLQKPKIVPERDSCVFRPPVDQPFVVEVRCETVGRMKRVVYAMERPEEFCNVGVQRRVRDFGACLPQLHRANESWMLVHDEQTLPKAKRVFPRVRS